MSKHLEHYRPTIEDSYAIDALRSRAERKLLTAAPKDTPQTDGLVAHICAQSDEREWSQAACSGFHLMTEWARILERRAAERTDD